MPDPGVSWVTGGGSRAAAGGSRAAAGGSWVAPSIRIPIHSPVPPARSPQPLPRPLVRAAQAALRERAPQAEFVAPTGQMFEVLHSTTPPRVEAPAYTHYRALGSLAGQRLAAHHAHEHVPCLAEYAAILRAHEEEVRKNRPGYSRQAARQERELTLTPSRPKTPAASVFSADTPSPSPPRSEGGYSTKPDRSTGARAGKPSADGTAACAGSAQDHADQNGSTSTYVSFDQFVAQHAAVYATELAAARTLTSVLATARAAVPGTQRASTWGPTEPSDAQQGSNAARDDEESADLSVAYVLRPPVRSSVSPLPADSAGGEWRDAVAAEVERRHDARHGGAARYEHGQHVLHFGGAPAVHAKCCVALGEQLRRTRAEFKTLTQLQMEHVLSSASVMLFARYCMVYRQGSLAQHLFLLIDGELSRHELDGSTSKLQLPNYAINSAEQQTVYGPTLFGEDCYSHYPMRVASVRAERPSLVMALHVDSLPRSTAEACRLELYAHLLSSIRLFAHLVDRVALLSIAALACLEVHRTHSVIFRQGEHGDRLFLLLKGRVGVVFENFAQLAGGAHADGEPERPRAIEVGQIMAGMELSTFGEMAVFDSKPRSASIVAKELVITLSIPSSGFGALLQTVPDLGSRLHTARKALAKLNELQRSEEEWLDGIMQQGGKGTEHLIRQARGSSLMQRKVGEAIAINAGRHVNGTQPAPRASVARVELERRARREQASATVGAARGAAAHRLRKSDDGRRSQPQLTVSHADGGPAGGSSPEAGPGATGL